MAHFGSGFAFPLGGDPPPTPTSVSSVIPSEIDPGKEDISMGNISAETGRFNFVIGPDGDVSFDTTGAHAVLTSGIERRQSWWADETHGSDLFNLKSLTIDSRSQAEAMTMAAEQPLVDAGIIDNPEAHATSDRNLGRLAVNFSWNSPSGDRIEVEV